MAESASPPSGGSYFDPYASPVLALRWYATSHQNTISNNQILLHHPPKDQLLQCIATRRSPTRTPTGDSPSLPSNPLPVAVPLSTVPVWPASASTGLTLADWVYPTDTVPAACFVRTFFGGDQTLAHRLGSRTEYRTNLATPQIDSSSQVAPPFYLTISSWNPVPKASTAMESPSLG